MSKDSKTLTEKMKASLSALPITLSPCTSRWCAAFLILLGCAMQSTAQQPKLVSLSSVQTRFASSNEAQRYLQTEDLFLRSLSAFDRSARLKTSKDTDTAEYVKFITGQTKDWTDNEKEKIRTIMQCIGMAIADYKLLFPQEIVFVKTTGKEEGNAAYCRGDNVIVLPNRNAAQSIERLYRVILHELFHIYSRNNPDIQEKLYSILSFQKCQDLKWPDDIFRKKITNPDAARDHYSFSSQIQGTTYELMPILLATSDYDEKKGGEFFDYLKLHFIAVTKNGDNMSPLVKNDKYVMFALEQVPNYFELIGRNTDYIIHPEEIIAENFVLLIENAKNLPNMDILSKMKKVLPRSSQNGEK